MSGPGWWTGTRLVSGRAIVSGWSSRSWKVVTGLMLMAGLASIIVPRMLSDQTPSYTLATVGQPPAAVQAQLEQVARVGQFEVSFLPAADEQAAIEAVRDGKATIALVGSGAGAVLHVASGTGATFPTLVAQAVLADSTAEALRESGLSPEQIATIQSTPLPAQVPVGRVADEGRAGVGFASGLVLYLALILTGTSIGTAVATEKSTRISEVLLAVLRPTQLLVGTVLGVGVLGLIQVAALAVPAAVGVLSGGGLDVPAESTGDIALAVVWFVLGMVLYAFVFAALASLVEKVTEVGSVTTPVNIVIVGSYLLAVTVTGTSPNSWAAVAGSLFPLSAPLVMPVRWASGLVPTWQLGLSMLLTAGAAVLLALLASRIYARGITRTGRRVRLREALSD